MNTKKKYSLIFSTALVTEFLFACYSYSIAHSIYFLQYMTCFCLPFTSMLGVTILIDAHTWADRVRLTSFLASGKLVGTFLLSLLVIYKIHF